MIPAAISPRPSELYEKLEGKYVQVQGGNALHIGKLRTVDFQNGVLILDEVPILNPAKKVFTLDNTRIIPFGSDTLGELTLDAYRRLVAEFSTELQFINKWVTIDQKYFGKLDNIHMVKYELNPAVVELQPRQWMYTDGSLFVPRDFQRSVIVPVPESYCSQLVADTVLRIEEEKLKDKLAAAELRRQFELYDKKAELEGMELEARFLGVKQALTNFQGRPKKETPDPSSLISTLRRLLTRKQG